jgi:hypothetical protein
MREGSYDAASQIMTKADPSLGILVDVIQGNRQRAMTRIPELEKTIADPAWKAYLLAEVYSCLGEDGKAVSALEDLYAINPYLLLDIKVNPYWNWLHSHRGFAALLKRIGLDQ